MNKTKTRCLSLAMVIVGVLVIGSGVASGQGVAITCDSSTVDQGTTNFNCFFTVINASPTIAVTGLVVTVDGVAVPCFYPGTPPVATTTLTVNGTLGDRCTGDLFNGTVPFTCQSGLGTLYFLVETTSTSGGGGNANNGLNINELVCNDQDACTTDSCIRTDDPTTTAEGCQTAAINCVDADACTLDSCDTETGCAHDPDPACVEGIEGRMTGGGSIFGVVGSPLQRVTHGFELHCDYLDLPNNLQINWGNGNRFHLEALTSASCTDDLAIDQRPPGHSPFDTFIGTGEGSCNGVTGATISFTFVDAGEPGKNDTATIDITCADGSTLSVSGSLKKGNHQAHRTN